MVKLIRSKLGGREGERRKERRRKREREVREERGEGEGTSEVCFLRLQALLLIFVVYFQLS